MQNQLGKIYTSLLQLLIFIYIYKVTFIYNYNMHIIIILLLFCEFSHQKEVIWNNFNSFR